MIRRLLILMLCALPLGLLGCSDGGTGGLGDREVHPASWIASHPAPALATAGFADCVSCHGADLAGSGGVVSCFSCHAYNDAPPFIVHPADWADPYFEHRGFAALNGSATCTGCHGAGLRGTPAAPSCFSTDFNGLGCHAEGPGQVPHPLDGSYLSGALHGPEAKADLTVCQNCHGEPGGPGSNPRFNIGIESVNGTGCEGCHGLNYAHPAAWMTPAPAPHASAGNLENACTLCHGVDLAGGVGVSCLLCHGANPALNPAGCVSCHGQPPLGEPPVGNVSPNRAGQHIRAGHTLFISRDPAQTCARCHGGAGFGTANHFDFTTPADVNIVNPPGDPSDTISAVSDGVNTTCNGNCHSTFNGSDVNFDHVNEVWY